MSIVKLFRSGRHAMSCRQGLFLFQSVLLAGLLFFSGFETLAQGNLLITPRRVVFDGNKRSFDLNLANTGKDSATYAISIIQLRMTDDGGFKQITEPDPGQLFADKYIRFFPRSVKLGPGESQALKIQLIRSNELKEGEYRSHFYFRAVPKEAPLGEEENVNKDTTSFSVRITPIFGIAIPVIIQNGTSTAKVNLSDLKLTMQNDTIPVFTFQFNRTGNMSVYGNVLIDHISQQGKVTRVGIANGVAVYTPNTFRKFVINLTVPSGVDLKSGKIKVTYMSASDIKSEKYTEAELSLSR